MTILPYFWQTKTLIIDDNEEFLEELALLLNNDKKYIFLTDPREAQRIINEQQDEYDWYVRSSNSRGYGQEAYDVDYKSIHTMLYNTKRNNVISTVIVDHNMPIMSGIEFCNSITPKTGIRKILLTASMGYQSAIDNLNKKFIDRFLVKAEITVDLIANALKEEEIIFFKNKGNLIKECMILNNLSIPIHEKKYTEYFNSVLKQHDIKEYYLLNELGWYLLVNYNGKTHGLFIFSKEEIQEMYNEALFIGVESKLCKELEKFKKALCYYNPSNSGWPSALEWNKYLYEVQKIIVNNNDYYVTAVPDLLAINDVKMY